MPKPVTAIPSCLPPLLAAFLTACSPMASAENPTSAEAAFELASAQWQTVGTEKYSF